MNIENEFLRVGVTKKGGSLTSIYDKERKVELLYQPRSDSWQGQDVFIFPFVARLKEGKYMVDGKEYSMKNHGLIRYMDGDISIEKNGDIKVQFASSEETRKQYPFDFRAYSLYHLNKKSVVVSYHIFNLSGEEMPFMVGGHSAFKVPGVEKEEEFDISGTNITFEKRRHLRMVALDPTGSSVLGEKAYRHTDKILLSKAFFRDCPTLILKSETLDKVTLNKTDGSSIVIKKTNIPYLAIWSDTKFGDYVAVEPWNGIPDEENPKPEMKEKKAISILEPGKEFVFSYTIEVH